MNKKPRIGLLGLTLELYQETIPELVVGRDKFAHKVIKLLEPEVDIAYSGPCYTREMVDKAVKDFETQGCDGIMVMLLSYSPSLMSLPALKRTKLPIIIWNTQEDLHVAADAPDGITFDNHGVHGVQDLCNVLRRSDVKYKVFTSHWEDETGIHELVKILKVARAVSELQNAKIGLIGYPMQDMGDFNIDETGLLAQIGAAVTHIPVDVLADYIEKAPESAINEIMEHDIRTFNWDKNITESEHRASAATEWGVRQIIKEYGLKGWSQHFTVLDSCERVPVLPFLVASKLMAEGYTYAAEGDVNAATMSLAVNAICGQSTFTEMFTMDFKDGAALMSHMGELNVALSRQGTPVNVIRKPFPLVSKQSPPTPVFEMEPGETTLVSLSPGLNGRFQLVIAEGEVIDFKGLDSINSPNFKWKPNADFGEFLDTYASYGGSHHQSMGYGKIAHSLELLGYFLDLDVFRVC